MGDDSKIAVPLKDGTAMAAEVAGVCVLTGIIDLIFCKCSCAQSVNQCINRTLKKDVVCVRNSDVQAVSQN